MLENCKPGDILISKHGTILKFVKHLSKTDYYDCEVEYLIKDGKCSKMLGNGTRNYDGSVFKNNKRDDDEDIIQVISKEEFNKITRFEYITDKGRQVVEYGEFEFELQDDNRTLKVFKK